jgi:hypothetical protein
VRQVFPDGLQLVSPWNSPGQVAAVRVGKLRIDPLTGMELHRAGTLLASEEDESVGEAMGFDVVTFDASPEAGG